MPISLSKGQNVSLTKTDPGLKKVNVGLGWDIRVTDGAAFDLDASAFVLKADGKIRSDADFIFYNQKTLPDGTIEHKGDNKTGEGAGDDEVVAVNLEKLAADIDKITFVVTIHEADTRRQTFGQVSKAYIRVVNADSNTELARYDLSEDASTETALIFGELYRNGAEWKFRAVGQGSKDGLGAIARNFGVSI